MKLNNKRGLSNLVAYVLLIAITISLSVLVYGWLKFYVQSDEAAECPESVNLVIDSYSCFKGVSGNLTVRLKNKGLFNVDGYILRVHNRTGAEFGIYSFDETGELVGPGKTITKTYNFSDYSVTSVTLVDAQPFLIDEDSGEKVSCELYSSQVVTCN